MQTNQVHEQGHALTGASLDTKYLQDPGTVVERMLILVGVEKLMTSLDIEPVEASAA